jgi:hypothetical protein
MKPQKVLFRIIRITGILVFILILVFTLLVVLRPFALHRDGFGRISILVSEGRNTSTYRFLYTKKHSLAKFSKIKIGMTSDEIFGLVGLPTDSHGSGIWWYYYKMDKGWHVRLLFAGGTLSEILIVDGRNDRVFELRQDIPPDTLSGHP